MDLSEVEKSVASASNDQCQLTSSHRRSVLSSEYSIYAKSVESGLSSHGESEDENVDDKLKPRNNSDTNDASSSTSPQRLFHRMATDPDPSPRRRRNRFHSEESGGRNQKFEDTARRRQHRTDSSLGSYLKTKDAAETDNLSRSAIKNAIASIVSGRVNSKFSEILVCLAEEHERALTQAMSGLIAENAQLTRELRQTQQCLQSLNMSPVWNDKHLVVGEKLALTAHEEGVDHGVELSGATNITQNEPMLLQTECDCSDKIEEHTCQNADDGRSKSHVLPSLLTGKREFVVQKLEVDHTSLAESATSENSPQPITEGSHPCPPDVKAKEGTSPTSPKGRSRTSSFLQIPMRKTSVATLDRKNPEHPGSGRNSVVLPLDKKTNSDSYAPLPNIPMTVAALQSTLLPTLLNVPASKRDSIATTNSTVSRMQKFDEFSDCCSVDYPGTPLPKSIGSPVLPGSKRGSYKHVTHPLVCPRELPQIRDIRNSWRASCTLSQKDGSYVSEADAIDDSIKILHYWRVCPRATMRKASDTGMGSTTSRNLRLRLEEYEGSLDLTVSLVQRLAKQLIIRPGSQKQVVWDACGVTFMVYDLVMIPLQTFELPSNPFTTLVPWLSSSFWTLAIPISFCTGFNSEGVAEVRYEQIAYHYARTWLAFDVIIVSIDWSIHILDAIVLNSDDYWLSVRTLRALRLIRLVRYLKLRAVVNDITERVRSEFTLVMIGLARVIIFVMLLNHLIACAWYSIGVWYDEDDPQNTWVGENRLLEKGWCYRYFTSLHWSLTQFTPASMEIMPTNTLERIFSVLVLLFAMLTFSSLVSSITNAMTQLRNLNSEKLEQMSMLRRYLGENKASNLIMGRIWGCLDQVADKSKRRIHQKDVTLLSILPSNLKGDLLEEVYSPIVSVHPFWKQLAHAMPVESKRISQNAITELSITIGHEVFNAGEEAQHMFFILSGMLTYKIQSAASGQPALIVTAGSWASEASLWIEWKHAGQLAATTHCEVITIQPASFSAAVAETPEILKYASLFAEYFKEHPSKLSDIWSDHEAIQDLALKAFAEECEDEPSRRVPFSGQTLSEVMMGVVPQGIGGRRGSVSRLWHAITNKRLWQPEECLESLASSQRSSGCSSEASSSSSNSDSIEVDGDAILAIQSHKQYPQYSSGKSAKEQEQDSLANINEVYEGTQGSQSLPTSVPTSKEEEASSQKEPSDRSSEKRSAWN